MKLNPSIKEDWLKALRSGRYQQTQEALFKSDYSSGQDGYCCLGVLCQVVAEACKQDFADYRCESGEELPNEDLKAEAFEGYYDNPLSVRDNDRQIWSVKVNGAETTLYELNDKGVPFEKIADLIEEQL